MPGLKALAEGGFASRQELVRLNTRLPRPRRYVEEGERVVVFRHGRPVTEVVPVRSRESGWVRTAIKALKGIRETRSFDGIAIRQLIQETRTH